MNYRYQVLNEGPGRPAFSPRVSLVVPTGQRQGRPGRRVVRPAGQPAVQQAARRRLLALERRLHLAAARRGAGRGSIVLTDRADLFSPFLAGSAIYRAAPDAQPDAGVRAALRAVVRRHRPDREDTLFTLSPGFRGGWNVGDAQIVTGAAMPITWGERRHRHRRVPVFLVRAAVRRSSARLSAWLAACRSRTTTASPRRARSTMSTPELAALVEDQLRDPLDGRIALEQDTSARRAACSGATSGSSCRRIIL